jgi:hypothetical protein
MSAAVREDRGSDCSIDLDAGQIHHGARRADRSLKPGARVDHACTCGGRHHDGEFVAADARHSRIGRGKAK